MDTLELQQDENSMEKLLELRQLLRQVRDSIHDLRLVVRQGVAKIDTKLFSAWTNDNNA